MLLYNLKRVVLSLYTPARAVKVMPGSMNTGVTVVQVFAQVAKDYLSPASSHSSVSARNIFSGFKKLQRRPFFQNSAREIPADPKAQASAAWSGRPYFGP